MAASSERTLAPAIEIAVRHAIRPGELLADLTVDGLPLSEWHQSEDGHVRVHRAGRWGSRWVRPTVIPQEIVDAFEAFRDGGGA